MKREASDSDDVPTSSDFTKTSRRQSNSSEAPESFFENVTSTEETSLEENDGKKKKKYLAKFQSIFGDEKLVKSETLEKEIKAARDSLEGHYNEVKVDYDEVVKNELLEEYSAWIEKTKKEGLRNIYRENVIRQYGSIVPYPREPLPENNMSVPGPTTTWIQPDRDENGVVQKNVSAPCSVIEVGDINPPMVYWIPIEQSIISKDNLRLSHMPYFNDEKDDDAEFYELIKKFPDGIHGFSGNWSYINDWLLYKLLRAALPYFKGTPDAFYYALYSMYPNKFSQREFSEIFPKLCRMFAEIGFDPASLEPWKAAKEQQVAENLQDPQCYACLHHMCPIHGFKAEISPDFPGGEFFLVELPLPNSLGDGEETCSKSCWKSVKMEDVSNLVELNSEAIEEKKASIYLSKTKLAKMPIEKGATIATFYAISTSEHIPFCDIAAVVVEPDDEACAIRSCRDAYMLLLSIAEKVADRRIIAAQSSKKLTFNQRFENFWKIQKTYEIQNTSLCQGKQHKHTNKAVRLTAVTKLTACRHDGPCNSTAESCACRENKVCSYMCKCGINCAQRFPGCNCPPGQCRTKWCPCVLANWECNPLTCTNCNCDEIDSNGRKCNNFQMTRMVQKQMYCAPSEIAGYGLFLSEPVNKDEFIVEYVGERISDDEVERRGAIYDRFNCSYIFNIETGGAIDSYKVGNLSRFANNESKNPSCYAKTMVVAGEHRIGFYAKRKLEMHEELTLDYNYSREHQITFKMNNKKNSTNSSSSTTMKTQDMPSTSTAGPSSSTVHTHFSTNPSTSSLGPSLPKKENKRGRPSMADYGSSGASGLSQ